MSMWNWRKQAKKLHRVCGEEGANSEGEAMLTSIIMRKLSDLLCVQHYYCGTSCNAVKSWKWNIPSLIRCSGSYKRYAVLILNRPVTTNHAFMMHFWNNAAIRMTVDGGTLRWDTFLKQSPESYNSMKLPDLVTGDFDSIGEEILQKYREKGCKVIHTPDQDYTDFTKALGELKKHCLKENVEVDHVLAVGQASGRLDHILGNIQSMFLAREKNFLHSETRVYLISDNSLSWIIYPGKHVIIIPEETRNYKKAWCSLVPIAQECKNISTTGLKWNLDNHSLRFGELVSTSNGFDGSEFVEIKCTEPVLWSMCVPSLSEHGKCSSKL